MSWQRTGCITLSLQETSLWTAHSGTGGLSLHLRVSEKEARWGLCLKNLSWSFQANLGQLPQETTPHQNDSAVHRRNEQHCFFFFPLLWLLRQQWEPLLPLPLHTITEKKKTGPLWYVQKRLRWAKGQWKNVCNMVLYIDVCVYIIVYVHRQYFKRKTD